MKVDCRIDIRNLTRVEGHGNILIRIHDGRVQEARWEVVETPRFFEAMLVGKRWENVPWICGRICGICSVGHTLASIRAIEHAFGIVPSGLTEKLRLLLKHMETLQSHILHLYFLSAPDYLAAGSVFPLIESSPDVVARAMRIKQLANDLVDSVGGRRMHPTRTVVGGFTMLPEKEELVPFRDRLKKAIALPPGGSIKVVETPPGPPVLATLLAEIYGPNEAVRRATALEVEKIFKSVPYIVDVDNSFGLPRPTLRLVPDRAKLVQYGLSERQVLDSIGALMGNTTVGYAPRGADRDPLPIEMGLDQAQRSWSAQLAATPVAVAPNGQLLPLGELVTARMEQGGQTMFRRDGRGATMVTAELAGRYEAPIYGMLAVGRAIDQFDWKAHGLEKPEISLHGQPEDESHPSLLWDGEWEITWVTFRDMGAAFMAALLGIYVLVVGQFRSFTL
ncbi:MAG: efflux RND transporter permease subunit, partial [Nitrospiraceae bacterium]|nr:efflux RND transporter permease subunit [Nitrospiraceae bacterium]